MRQAAVALMAVVALGAPACGGDQVAPAQARTDLLRRVPAEDWDRLASARIAFGHQSVGQDILTGVADLAKELPALKLNVVASPAAVPTAGLVHFQAGLNEQPTTKVDAFVKFVDTAASSTPDVAMVKFCYIDVNQSTDVRALFTYYRTALAGLRTRHPGTAFVHLTMPLRTVQSGWKVTVKNLIGRPIGGYGDNARRHEYNELLRTEYRGREPMFDLAAIESTRLDGSRVSFATDGQTAFALAPEYTYDGGHLNEAGRRYVAEQFLLTLAEAARGRRPQ